MNKETPSPPAIFLMGPTASGKTDLALTIANDWPVEVISVDSALIYREMNIGTAKPDKNFLKKLPHFLIDIRDPDQMYSAADFRRDALALMHEITDRGSMPLLVGGTMLYYKVLVDGLASLPATDDDIRKKVLTEAEQIGWPAMHEKLTKVDPKASASIHPNHSQRIQRALEVFYMTGEQMSAIQSQQVSEPLPFNLLQLALWPIDRQQLHSRIAQRFQKMLDQGFIDEVRHLRQSFTLNASMTSMRAVGYRQAWEYLEGRINYDLFLEQGIAATRQLAKRQFTWMRKWPDLHRLNVNFDDSDPLSDPYCEIYSKISKLVD